MDAHVTTFGGNGIMVVSLTFSVTVFGINFVLGKLAHGEECGS
jgi:hypothetical protein